MTLPPDLRIIERERWERVQTQLVRNSSFAPRNAKHTYLLKGLVRCGGCRARYVGDPNHGRFYYRCHQRCKSYPTIREELLDRTVWEAVKEAMLNPAIIISQLKHREQNAEAQRSKFKLEVGEIDQALRKIDEEEARVLEAYRKAILTPAVLGRELEQLGVRRSGLSERRAALPTTVPAMEPRNIHRSIEEFSHDAAQGIESFTVLERQRFLQLLVDNIVYEGERLIIKGVIPIKLIAEENDSEQQRQQRSVILTSDRTVTTGIDHYARNSVDSLGFEIRKTLRGMQPFRQRYRNRVVLRLARKHSRATLRSLCEYAWQERGLKLTITTMCKVLRPLKTSREESKERV